jgi:glycosyltransferase involved in cell wall biosynthesis
VNWNSLEYLRTAIAAVRHFSPPSTRIIVVDNASGDGSDHWLSAAGITTISLPRNVGHGPALDLGFFRARTRYVIALDVDAFPISDRWIDELRARLEGGATVAGAHGGRVLDTPFVPAGWERRDFVHPCCLAMRLRRFVFRRRTFRRDAQRRKDPGELLSDAERPKLSYLEPTSHLGPGVLGTVFGELVYHNFYAVRHLRQGAAVINGVTREDAVRTWERARRTLLCQVPM